MHSQQEVIASLPAHLRPFVAIQNYADYTPRDHAIWRFLLHQLSFSLRDSAHPTYFEGLKATGIGFEQVPKIEGINECLNKLGWRAVAVDGFLPPAVFMEFQAQRILAIALNIRSFEHMLYTPAPDIVHESAGHAPFLVDIDYAEFLQRFGELGMQAIANQHDLDVYEAVRELSIVKEDPSASADEIDTAQQHLEQLQLKNVDPSEANLLARLHWWTVEYGLVGDVSDYHIFGAGLLSSLAESQSCMNDEKVPKYPLTLEAIRTSYDITCAQPQLFVTQSCRHLSQILAEYGQHMCGQRGGTSALLEALEAGSVNTITYNSGLQVSGKINQAICDAVGNVMYLGTDGPTQLAYDNQQLAGHGVDNHASGFGSPVGKLRSMEGCLSTYTVDELKRHNIVTGNDVELNFLSGVSVAGKLKQIVRRNQKNILLSFEGCTVRDVAGNVLFDPEWGNYDMAVGGSIDSVVGGTADKVAYPLYEAPAQSVRVNQEITSGDNEQFQLYAALQQCRKEDENPSALLLEISENASLDWLLYFEALELLLAHKPSDDKTQKKLLTRLKENTGDAAVLIQQGLARIDLN